MSRFITSAKELHCNIHCECFAVVNNSVLLLLSAFAAVADDCVAAAATFTLSASCACRFDAMSASCTSVSTPLLSLLFFMTGGSAAAAARGN